MIKMKNSIPLRLFWILFFTSIIKANNDTSLNLEENTIPIVFNHQNNLETPISNDSSEFSINPQVGLILERLCSLDTRVDNPKIHIFTPDKYELISILCKKHLLNLKPQKLEYFNWGTKTKKTRSFRYKNNNSQETSTLLAWEYKNQIPMWWKLRCPHDLKNLICYLKKSFLEMEMTPISTNRLLVTIEQVDKVFPLLIPQKSTQSSFLSKEESDFLYTYFTIVDQPDEIKQIVGIHKQMLKTLTKFNLLEIGSPDEGPIVSLVKWIYSKTSLKDILMAIIFYKVLCLIKDLREELSKTVKTFSHHASFDELVERALRIKEDRDRIMQFTGNLGQPGSASRRRSSHKFTTLSSPKIINKTTVPQPGF